MRLRDKVLKHQRPVVIYEILPPRIVDGSIESYAERISTLLSQTHIDAINIPEVHAEKSRGQRPVNGSKRAEPRVFGRLIQDAVGIEAIINRVTVHESPEAQSEWFRSTYDEYGIENIVLVGGESSSIDYPGPGVIDSTSIIKEINSELETGIFCGGISLPSRKVESIRMLGKGANGIDFFTTQVLYDSDDIKKMLGHYQRACEENNQTPKRIFLSFAPISTAKNMEFLKWLGVDVPSETEDYMIQDSNEITNRSIEVSVKILNDVLRHVVENNITVPIGLNIEHIMSYNFRHSVRLLQTMSKQYRRFCIDTNLFQQQDRVIEVAKNEVL